MIDMGDMLVIYAMATLVTVWLLKGKAILRAIDATWGEPWAIRTMHAYRVIYAVYIIWYIRLIWASDLI